MRVVIQKVKSSSVVVDEKIIGKINKGLNLLVGFTHNDTKVTIDKTIDKILKLRIFEDRNNKMNLSIKDVGGEVLLISQFTLYADPNSGNRPSFTEAANAILAKELYNYMLEKMSTKLTTYGGQFGADMKVSIINDGPVTIILNSDKK